jgi:hypothetical protein
VALTVQPGAASTIASSCTRTAPDRRASMRIDTPLRMLWAAPCSLLGLGFALAVLLVGGRARWARGALEITYRAQLDQCGRRLRRMPFRGVVFGHVILAVTAEELMEIGAHERVHVEQYGRWGLLFLPAYAASSLWQLLRGRDAYWHNHFEVDARRRSGEQP